MSGAHQVDVKSLSELDTGGRETCMSFSLCQIVMLCLKPKHDKAYTQTLIAQYLLSTWDKRNNYHHAPRKNFFKHFKTPNF